MTSDDASLVFFNKKIGAASTSTIIGIKMVIDEEVLKTIRQALDRYRADPAGFNAAYGFTLEEIELLNQLDKSIDEPPIN